MVMSSELTQKLSSIAKKMGADLFGIADLRPVQKLVVAQGGERLSIFSHAVAIGLGLSNTVVNQIDPLMPADFSVYGWHVYKAVSPTVDNIALQLARELQRWGFEALPVPTSQFRQPGERMGLFSHKLAAHLAGLGFIGKNCLLITPQFGPRVRLASILTDCPLEPGTRIDGRCGDCRECVDVCPVDALSGVEFCDSEVIEKRLNVDACGGYRDGGAASDKRGAHVCGLCLAVCPRAYPQKEGWRHPLAQKSDPAASKNFE
ncbi:MAG: 4Fe-4S double cluster binding domain-containing protein [Candidatus Poribacteria bacterium]